MELDDKFLLEVDGRCAVGKKLLAESELPQEIKDSFDYMFSLVQGLKDQVFSERVSFTLAHSRSGQRIESLEKARTEENAALESSLSQAKERLRQISELTPGLLEDVQCALKALMGEAAENSVEVRKILHIHRLATSSAAEKEGK